MSETENIAIEKLELPASPAARRAATRRAKADYAREWRQDRRAAGWPEARKVDAALVESVTFCMRDHFIGHDGFEKTIGLERLFRCAVLVLMRDGADRDLAQQAIRERLAPRDEHLQQGFVPSFRMDLPGFWPLNRKGDLTWGELDITAMVATAKPHS